ncbi:hypothetical protein [Microbacterium foliorum]|uniref:hypothetical protein n=1 Tax=Microbacterium foliorum TaxID=104336 RepID=UPI001E070A02|nr:hypothetical protein [Microbacterium foliorum]CAH0125982.1 hypothetical protein SRABI44_00078 [Microbacterium foliorum]CAH0128018.1 hypothetical protein SRABI03_00199 [Microbacterium foliorum]
MTSDSDDALSWDGDEGGTRKEQAPKKPRRTPAEPGAVAPTERTAEDPALSGGWNAVGRGSAAVGRPDDDDEPERPPLSTGMLLTLGVVGGVYLLYSIGWVVGGMRLKPLANLIVADAMYMPWFVLAVAAPALWFLAVWVLTRARAGWIRVALLLLGVVLLVPWPFVTVGVIGS